MLSSSKPTIGKKIEYSSTEEAVEEIARFLEGARRVLVCGHLRPDGDCIGSMHTLCEYLKGRGKEVRLFFQGPVKDVFLTFLADGQGPSEEFPKDYGPDLTVCVDTASANRVVDGFEEMAQGTVVNIDHHVDNTRYGEYNWVDHTYASVGEMLFDLVDALPDAWTPSIARALYLAVATDTGGFRFSNTSAQTFEMAGRLVRMGADPAAIASAVWGDRTMETMQIAGAVLNDLHFELDGRLVWAEITQEIFNRFGGEANEPENLSGELRAIRGVEVAALLRETPGGTARASLRSSGVVDVGVIAGRLGGGGHRAAAGLEVREAYAKARDRIVRTAVESVREQLDGKKE